MSAVVSDSSPLNYLALLSDFDLLRQIYRTVVIPPAVYREVVESGADYPVAKAVEAALGDWASVAGAPGPASALLETAPDSTMGSGTITGRVMRLTPGTLTVR